MKKLGTALLLAFCLALLLSFPGCQKGEGESSGGGPKPESTPASTEPLRVLADFEYNNTGSLTKMSQVLSTVTVESTDKPGLKNILKEKGGPNVKFEYPPTHGTERDTYLTNLRVEIMGGAGPDVFLCTAFPGVYMDLENISGNMVKSELVEPVFKFPAKAIQNRVFLPLDERIGNAQFMEFDKLTPVVMEAGKYQGVQYLLPTGYSIPLTCFPKGDFPFDYPAGMTWQEMGEAGPELKAASTALCTSVWCGFLFQPFIDYEKDEPAFTEEELLALVRGMKERIAKGEGQAMAPCFGQMLSLGFASREMFESTGDPEAFSLEEGLSMVPVYSVQGGCRATVTSFAAINANTKRPDDAFFFLDYWMSEECQSSAAFGAFNYRGAVPTIEGLMTEEKPCAYESGVDLKGKLRLSQWSMTDAVYEDFCKLRDNIASADFATEVDTELRDLISEAVYGEGSADLEKLVHETYMRMKMMAAES